MICLVTACFRIICEECITHTFGGYDYSNNKHEVAESNNNVTNINTQFIKATLVERV